MITQEKAQTIANCFAMTGFKNKSEALLKAGYKPSYANCGRREVVYKNVLVMKEIKALMDAQALKTATTMDDIERMYAEDREFAKTINQAGPMVSATTGIARLYGFDKDNQVGEKTVIVIAPKASPTKQLPKQVDSEVIE